MELDTDMDVTGRIIIKEEICEGQDGVAVFIQVGELDTSDDTTWDTTHLESMEDPLSLSNIEVDRLDVKGVDSEVKIEIVKNEVDAERSSAGGIDIFRCVRCNYTCLVQDLLDKHVRSRHGHVARDGKYKCDKCAYSTDQSSHMKGHLVTHTGDCPFSCNKCDKAFTRQCHLTQHIRAVHDGLRPYSCNVCGKTFARAGYLTVHQRIHTGTSVVQCEQCGKQFTDRSYYIKHMKLHDGVKAHKCQVCSSRFVQRWELTVHMRTHTVERPYACPHCSAAFTRQSHMKTHVISAHTHDYKHRCERCGKGFRAPNELRIHGGKCTS